MVDLEELPIPPGETLLLHFLVSFSSCIELKPVSYKCIYFSGFPPIPGHKSTGAEQGFVAALVAADKLTATDTGEIADGQNDEEEVCW